MLDRPHCQRGTAGGQGPHRCGGLPVGGGDRGCQSRGEGIRSDSPARALLRSALPRTSPMSWARNAAGSDSTSHRVTRSNERRSAAVTGSGLPVIEVIIETGDVLWRPSRFARSQDPAGHFRDTPRGGPRTPRVWAEMTRLAGRVVHSSPHSTRAGKLADRFLWDPKHGPGTGISGQRALVSDDGSTSATCGPRPSDQSGPVISCMVHRGPEACAKRRSTVHSGQSSASARAT